MWSFNNDLEYLYMVIQVQVKSGRTVDMKYMNKVKYICCMILLSTGNE